MRRLRKRVEDLHTQHVPLRLTPAQEAALDRMRQEGGYRSKAELARSIILEVLRDDAREHAEAAE